MNNRVHTFKWHDTVRLAYSKDYGYPYYRIINATTQMRKTAGFVHALTDLSLPQSRPNDGKARKTDWKYLLGAFARVAKKIR